MESAQTKEMILVVDNDERILEIMRARMLANAYGCLTAITGGQGLALFDEQRIDLVITDMNMPGCDGISFTEELRRRSDVPIIMMTAYPLSYQAVPTKFRRVCLFAKPFPWEGMLQRIRLEIDGSHTDSIGPSVTKPERKGISEGIRNYPRA